MSDHWNTLARLLGAPGASAKNTDASAPVPEPVAPPASPPEPAAPAARETRDTREELSMDGEDDAVEAPAGDVLEAQISNLSSGDSASTEPDLREKNWNSLAELLDIRPEEPKELPTWLTQAPPRSATPAPKGGRAEPRGEPRGASKKRRSGFAEGLAVDGGDASSDDLDPINEVPDDSYREPSRESPLVLEDEPMLPGWESAEMGAPSPAWLDDEPPPRRSAFDDEPVEGGRSRGSSRGGSRGGSRERSEGRHGGPRDRSAGDSVGPRADRRSPDDLDAGPSSSPRGERRSADPIGPEGSEGDEEDRGRRRRRRRRRRGGSGAAGGPDTDSAAPIRDAHDIDSGIDPIEADDVWAEVEDDGPLLDVDRVEPEPSARKPSRGTPPRVEFDDDHEDAEEVVAMRRGRRRRRLRDEPVAEAKEAPIEREAPPPRRPSRRREEIVEREREREPEPREVDMIVHDDDDHDAPSVHRNIPTWLDAVDILITANMDSRRREPQRRGRGGPGGGGNPGGRRR